MVHDTWKNINLSRTYLKESIGHTTEFPLNTKAKFQTTQYRRERFNTTSQKIERKKFNLVNSANNFYLGVLKLSI